MNEILKCNETISSMDFFVYSKANCNIADRVLSLQGAPFSNTQCKTNTFADVKVHFSKNDSTMTFYERELCQGYSWTATLQALPFEPFFETSNKGCISDPNNRGSVKIVCKGLGITATTNVGPLATQRSGAEQLTVSVGVLGYFLL
jgi:hypothetical protein